MFLARWSPPRAVPLVMVMTLIPDFSAAQLHQRGFGRVLMANQPMRASVRAMEETLQLLREDECATTVDAHIASVGHIVEQADCACYVELDDDAF